MGHTGMKYSLPSRELIADSVESMTQAHCFDGLVCLANCDKIIPGMLMAAARLNVPTILVSGGPMETGRTPDGKPVDLSSLFEGVGAVKGGKMSEKELEALEACGCPGRGSCAGLFTANSMNCLTEALGMALPGNGTRLAVSEERKELVRQAGRQILQLVAKDLKPRDILTQKSIDNAFILDMAMGGSTNTVLHTIAIAHEAGITYSLKRINELLVKTMPHIFTYVCCRAFAPITSPSGCKRISANRERSEMTDTSSKCNPFTLPAMSRLIFTSMWLLGSSMIPWCFT